MWSIILDLAEKPRQELRLAIEEVLEPMGEALSSFETNGGRSWRIEVLAPERPSASDVRLRLRGICRVRPVIERVADKDWVAESERGLPPLSVGPFFVHGSHFKGRYRPGCIAFRIDAGVAFGTGRHETTRLCLRALLRLAERGRYLRPLDLGTGTGILAFAMARLFECRVLAADNDRDAVRIARENATINQLADRVRVVLADRYSAPSLRAGRPYDLVTANILAGPLIDLAPGLARVLAPRGRAVLSGLLRTQEKEVLDAHQAVGLDLDFALRLKGWSALVLGHAGKRKPAAGKPGRRLTRYCRCPER
jgi:ribosomal protein L11 methyltransferase